MEVSGSRVYVCVYSEMCNNCLGFFCSLFSELLQDLENCENDPVAIADCFVSKVRGYCKNLQHNAYCRMIWESKINYFRDLIFISTKKS